MDISKTSTIINKIMDMDLNDNIAMKNVIDIITSHPNPGVFVLAHLLATSTHEDIELYKDVYCNHNAYTADNLLAYFFKKKGEHYGFLVNIIESRNGHLRHGMPFERYGIICDFEDVPLPNVSLKQIEELVRINIYTDAKFIITKFNVSKLNKPPAPGRFYNVPNIDIGDIIMSLHIRQEGYKEIDHLTNFDDDDEFYYDYDDSDDDMDNPRPPPPPRPPRPPDTFENLILNYVHQLQRNVRSSGELITFVEGILLGVDVTRPYDGNGSNIRSIKSPVDGTLFIVAFDRTSKPTKEEQRCVLKTSLNNLISYYLPDYAYNPNKRNVILLALTYNTDFRPSYESVDNILSVRYSVKDEDFKNILTPYVKTISLRDRCRYVIVTNKHLLSNHINDLPPCLQSFISSERYMVEPLIRFT